MPSKLPRCLAAAHIAAALAVDPPPSPCLLDTALPWTTAMAHLRLHCFCCSAIISFSSVNSICTQLTPSPRRLLSGCSVVVIFSKKLSFIDCSRVTATTCSRCRRCLVDSPASFDLPSSYDDKGKNSLVQGKEDGDGCYKDSEWDVMC